MKFLILFFLIIPQLFSQTIPNTKYKSYRQGRTAMLKAHSTRKLTLYCECKYSGRRIDNSCPYLETSRAKQLEAEHVVSRSRLAKFWGGKKEAKKHVEYRLMESDPRNLYPANGGLNEARNNFVFGIIGGEPREFGTCDFEIENETVEPKENIRGDIARIYLHMERSYPEFKMTEEEKELMTAWNLSDPISDWEKDLNTRIDEDLGNFSK